MDKPILLFDGICNFCDNTVNFIIDRDPDKKILFAALQSKAGQEILMKFTLPTKDFDSVILVQNNCIYKKTSAMLRIVTKMRFPWSLLVIIIIIPPFIRNFFYDIIARNRYRWFGQKEFCRMPTKDVKERFLA